MEQYERFTILQDNKSKSVQEGKSITCTVAIRILILINANFKVNIKGLIVRKKLYHNMIILGLDKV